MQGEKRILIIKINAQHNALSKAIKTRFKLSILNLSILNLAQHNALSKAKKTRFKLSISNLCILNLVFMALSDYVGH